jgi:hypothetical protein
LEIDVALFSDTQQKLHMWFHIPNYEIYWIDCEDRQEGRTAESVKKGIPHTCANLLSPLSVEATGVCIPTRNTEMLRATVYKSPQRMWAGTDITELLGFRNKYILVGDLNTKHPAWNSKFSNSSGLKLLELFVSTNFEISAPQRSIHYTRDGSGHVLDTVVHQNFRLSEFTVTDILDYDHLPIIFIILDSVRIREALDPDEKLTDWELFQILASELKFNSSNKANKAAHDFAASMASAYRLSTRKNLDWKYLA